MKATIEIHGRLEWDNGGQRLIFIDADSREPDFNVLLAKAFEFLRSTRKLTIVLEEQK